MKKTFAVIGVGAFGLHVAKELIDLGADVLVIDINPEIISRVSSIATHAAIIDSTDPDALVDIGIKNIDHVVVAIGQDIEASIMTTLILKDLGVGFITVKVNNDYHAAVVEKLGADEIIRPQTEMGRRLAKRIISDSILEYLEISEHHSFVEMTPSEKICNIKLQDLTIRKDFNINIAAIRRQGSVFVPTADDEVLIDDVMMIIGENKAINKFERYLNNGNK